MGCMLEVPSIAYGMYDGDDECSIWVDAKGDEHSIWDECLR